MNANTEVVIGALARTPFGRFQGALRHVRAPDLGALAIDEVLRRSGVAPEEIGAAYLGVGMVGGATLSPARQAVLLSGLADATPSLTVDRACCSGMTAIGLGWKDIRLGIAEALICGGFESLSQTPLLMPRTRDSALGTVTVDDPLLLKAPVVQGSIATYTAEEALKAGVGRQAQDSWAAQSHARYFAAQDQQYFDFERFDVVVPNGKQGPVGVAADESPRADSSLEKLATLRTVHGSATITAGNAPGLNDGAAALLLLSRAAAARLGVPVLATVLDYQQVSGTRTSGSTMPAVAIGHLLKRHQLGLADLAQIEINEAFAATVLMSLLALAQGDHKRATALGALTNPHGGAVAIGHPLGASGARLVMTLVNGLRRRGGGLGVAAICGGFGQGDAVLLKVDDAA